MEAKNKAMLVFSILIFSSLAGCISEDNVIRDAVEDVEVIDEMNQTQNETLVDPVEELKQLLAGKTIIASTFHVQELVLAVVGSTVTVELMSTSNTPVHDYTPTTQDEIRLMNSDIFFYHGLNLEPWVPKTLSTLGDEAPLAIATHTMPYGEITLDYESLLVNDLCTVLGDAQQENYNLMSYETQASELEIYAEKIVHQLTFPAPDDDHSGHDDHDDHSGHDDHDDHSGHDDHDD
ncbi:MAG: hypothetical protein CL983_03800, partial [Euryarchaeota archaeon]|nr:hypothetical protein [Euryarchaeota archaeon]